MTDQQQRSGKWVVIVLLVMGIIGALAGLKFRPMPSVEKVPATTRV